VDLAPLVSGRHSLDEWPDAFASLRERRGLKVVIEP
jgi:threonine dehydrogenase-like Zn-dependent dehydrogenase